MEPLQKILEIIIILAVFIAVIIAAAIVVGNNLFKDISKNHESIQ